MIITADKDNFHLRLLYSSRDYVIAFIVASAFNIFSGKLSTNEYMIVFPTTLLLFSILFYFVTYRKNIYYLKSIEIENDLVTMTILKFNNIDRVIKFHINELDLEMLSEYSLQFFPKNYVVNFKQRNVKKEFTSGRNKGTILYQFDEFFSQRNYGFWTGENLKNIVELISSLKNKKVDLSWVK